MFTAVLFAVISGAPVALEDTLGPYETRQACERRVEEMAAHVVTVVGPGAVILGHDCREDEKDRERDV